MEEKNKNLEGEASCCNTKREDCPHCGRCPKCGRKTGDYIPRYPYPYMPYMPYPYDPYPWYPYRWDNGTVYCGSSNADGVQIKISYGS